MRSQSGFGYVVRFLQISYSLSCPFLSFVLVLVFVFILDIRAINLLKCFWLSMLPCVYAITVAIAYCYSNSSKVQHLFIRLEQFGFVDFEMENCVCLCIFFIIFFRLVLCAIACAKRSPNNFKRTNENHKIMEIFSDQRKS